jgi:predicted metalloprotease
MKWRGGRRSTNVEDRRGRRATGKGIKLGGWSIVAIVGVGWMMGINPLQMLNMLGNLETASVPTQSSQPVPANDEQAQFVSVVLADTEDVWNKLFASSGEQYREPGLVLFTGSVASACGMQSAAVGPFYCPGDEKVYIDLGFYQTLARMGGSGDFARAYVIGHEVGHHVQNILGTSAKVQRLKQRTRDEAKANALSVMLELQADCYAGVWAHHAEQDRDLLEDGDVEEGLAAAAAIGDDRLMEQAGRKVRVESFTHGTSEQRARWLRKGLRSGHASECDTFNAASL